MTNNLEITTVLNDDDDVTLKTTGAVTNQTNAISETTFSENNTIAKLLVNQKTLEMEALTPLLFDGQTRKLLEKEDLGPSTFVLQVTAMASLNSILLGYDVGVMGGAIVYIEDEMHLSTIQTEICLGSLNFMGIVGAYLSGYVSDKYGRTKTLLIASVLFFIGNLLMAISNEFYLLLVGRMITGIGVGSGLAIDPLYISEMSPPKYRGRLVSASELCINIGIMLGFFSSFGFSYVNEGWRWMIICGNIIPCIVIFLTLYVMPETPRWLMKVGREDDAEKILEKVCNNEKEIEETKKDIVDSLTNTNTGWRELFCSSNKAIQRMLIVVLGVACFQQVVGIEAIMYYTPKILKDAGMNTREQTLGVTAAMGFFKTVCILLSAFLLDHGNYGRRIMLMYSTAGMTFALALIAIAFFNKILSLSILGIFLYVFFFSIGIGPVCWLLASEIFPLHVRAVGMSAATMINRLTSSIIALTFLSLSEAATTGGAFLIFSVGSFCAFIFAATMVPETQHKSLEEMMSYFEQITNSHDN